MKKAPLYPDIAEAPPHARSCWIEADDGVRLRLVSWGKGEKGTILLFPGRTEFVEKYGRTAAGFQARGYALAVIDWRGQGLSDRLVPNRKLGHVDAFLDYQRDVQAMLARVREMDLPGPHFLCAHSMGGTIALRALQSGLDVQRAVFSAPMWGLTIDPVWRPLVQAIAASGKTVGLGVEFAPGTGPENYLQSALFEGNVLTSDEPTWNQLAAIVTAHPGLTIGGPSIQWLYEALTETRALAAMPPPAQDALCLVGSEEQVVNKRDVFDYMGKWQHGQLNIITGAQHEILMETPAIRKRALDMIDLFFMG